MTPEFQGFGKIPRLCRDIIITEKIDGTNAQVCVLECGMVLAGSRSRWITPENDNHGFARWVQENEDELRRLGVGKHFGEWWGSGINRGYGLRNGEKRFSLFNTKRWANEHPKCCEVVPVLYQGPAINDAVEHCILQLRVHGSAAVPGFMRAEGIVLYHTAANALFKVTLENDEQAKGQHDLP